MSSVDTKKRFSCKHCNELFGSRNPLFKHLYDKHDEDGVEAKLRAEKDTKRASAGCLPRGIGPSGKHAVMRNLESRSAVDVRTLADETAQPVSDQDARGQPALSKPDISAAGGASVRPVMAIEDFRNHPSPIVKEEEVDPAERQWRSIGSGMFAKTCINASVLPVSLRGEPAECDVHQRIVRSLTTGKVVDDCIIDDTSDEVLRRRLAKPDNIRVELVMKDALCMFQKKGADVVELFSQPRIAQEAGTRQYGNTELVPGWSFDLTMRDPLTNEPWDLSRKDVQQRVTKMVTESKPFMVVGSPPCTAFSRLQELSKHKRDPKIVQKKLADAVEHIRFCFKIYKLQRKAGRLFAHEHPSTATSWSLPEVLDMLVKEDVQSVEVYMCHFGLKAEDADGVSEALVRKRTKVLTNASEVARTIARKCAGGHEHAHLTGGKAKRAQLYPRAFGRTCCEGVAAQKRLQALRLNSALIMSPDEMK